jgi:hypothetical protein
MSVMLELPPELEARLVSEAGERGLPLSKYILGLLTNGTDRAADFHNGAELLVYWQREGLVGTRGDIADSQQHARELRADSQRRGRF